MKPTVFSKAGVFRSWAPRLLAVLLVTAFSPQALLAGEKPKRKRDVGGRGEVVTETVPGYAPAAGMTYHIFIPEGVEKRKKYPLIFALHGNGCVAKGHLNNLKRCSTGEFPIFVAAPQYQAIPGKTNGPMFRRRREGYIWILNRLEKRYPIREDGVYFEGFSMGGSFGSMWCYGMYKDNPEEFPFRAMIYNSGCYTPIEDEYAPRVPHLYFAGTEGETEKAINRQSREAFNSLFRLKREVRFHEIQGMGHKINAEVRKIIRDFIVSDVPEPRIFHRMHWLDSESAALALRIERGEWKEGWSLLLERTRDETLGSKEKSNALQLKSRFERHLKDELGRLGKKLKDGGTLTFEEYRMLRRTVESLPDTRLAKTAGRLLSGGGGFESLAGEYEAWKLFHIAWDLEIESPEKGKAAFEALVQKFGEPEYGKRARERLAALEE
jgi:hypothetical protein